MWCAHKHTEPKSCFSLAQATWLFSFIDFQTSEHRDSFAKITLMKLKNKSGVSVASIISHVQICNIIYYKDDQ